MLSIFGDFGIIGVFGEKGNNFDNTGTYEAKK